MSLQLNDTTKSPILYMAMELSASKWKLCFGISTGTRKRLRTIDAGNMKALESEIALAKEKLHLSENAQVISCYEAGRDGFWIHRYLGQRGYQNNVVDSSSIEVSRKKRKRKTDRLDAQSLLRLLIRYKEGEKEVWIVCHVPSEAEEDKRRINRERERLLKEKSAHSNRIKSLLILHGIQLKSLTGFAEALKHYRVFDGQPLPPELVLELSREYERYRLVSEQLRALQRNMLAEIKTGTDRGAEVSKRLYQLRGLGLIASWLFSHEFFAWRSFNNRRQVGSCAGLTPTPYNSGGSEVEQGISKDGSKRIRGLAIEIAWLWLRYQSQSKLSRWYAERFASGGKRMRRIGIVAVARKLLVALWKFVEFGEIPEGAVLKAI